MSMRIAKLKWSWKLNNTRISKKDNILNPYQKKIKLWFDRKNDNYIRKMSFDLQITSSHFLLFWKRIYCRHSFYNFYFFQYQVKPFKGSFYWLQEGGFKLSLIKVATRVLFTKVNCTIYVIGVPKAFKIKNPKGVICLQDFWHLMQKRGNLH